MTLQRVEVLSAWTQPQTLLNATRPGQSSTADCTKRPFDDAWLPGVLQVFLPTSLGGLEVDPVTCALACERLANADTAARLACHGLQCGPL